jgi:calcineurin-like phosphoesterase family protein
MACHRSALLACMLAFAATPAAAQVLAATYVVLGAQGPVARAVVLAGRTGVVPQCPAIVVDGKPPQTMGVRTRPNADFPILVCEHVVPADATSALIDKQALPLPPNELKSIAVFGDTGCRLKAGKDADDEDEADEAAAAVEKSDDGKYQNCKTEWPFERISETIAEAAPSVVIHVGDYYYRESPCDGHAGCHDSPFGDKWETWEADFFTPAAALLKKAPWIVTRGNHEICKRGGLGYALLLDPTPVNGGSPPTCPVSDPPFRYDHYTVNVGGRSFIMLDSSEAADDCPKKGCDSDWYYDQFRAMEPRPGTWLITHKPIWGFTYSKNKKTGERELGIRNMTLQAALDNKEFNNLPPTGIELVLSGHIHLWEALSFKDGRSPQFVLGSGGTELAHKLPDDVKGQPIGGTKVAAIASDHHFGYTIFEPSKHGGHWDATYYAVIASCKVTPSAVDCN